MSEKKKQHYLPRFYLKYFSNNQTKTHIGLFLFTKSKFIREASIKNQAYENFFYGKDGKIEEDLGQLETKSSRILNHIILTNELPKLRTEEYTTIWIYTLIQACRTKYAAKETNEMVNKTLKSILKHDARFKDKIEKLEFGINETATFNLQTLISSLDTAKDLACKLVINKTGIPFITSDNPVIRYNQFLEKRKFPAGRTGLATKGLQIFYPINPNLTLLFYDSKVYKIGFKKRLIVEVSNTDDINNLNFLQALNCDELIYFPETATEYYISKIVDKRNKHYKKDRTEINEYPEKENPDGTFSQIMHFFKHEHDIKLKLTFIKETDHAKNYVLTGYAAELRDENLRQ